MPWWWHFETIKARKNIWEVVTMGEALERWQNHEGYITRAGDGTHMPSLPNDTRLSDRELYIYYAALMLGTEVAIQAMQGDEAAAQVMDEIIGED
jgi:hypothetical protein